MTKKAFALAALPARQRQGAAAGLMVVLLSSAYGLLISPAVEVYARNDRAISEISRRLTAIRAVAERAKDQSRQSSELADKSGFEALFVAGPGLALAGTALENVLGRRAIETGVTLKTLQPQAAKADDGYQQIPVRLTAGGNYQALMQFLYNLENGSPAIRIERLEITPDKVGVAQLRADILLHAFYREGPAS